MEDKMANLFNQSMIKDPSYNIKYLYSNFLPNFLLFMENRKNK